KSKAKCFNIDATIVCEKDSHKGIIIGKSGSMIKNIGIGSRIAIEKFTNEKVNLKLNVIVKNNWRDERTLLANYGYDGNEL
ncbi:MAG: KH domain-containing protein, partial [Lachnospiraceae bacterium]|nr:KH domain-containing protein [Lachnospiraceae bacterium]